MSKRRNIDIRIAAVSRHLIAFTKSNDNEDLEWNLLRPKDALCGHLAIALSSPIVG
jgi:hypothetical protein